jgi:hypothetical protein
LDIGIGDDTDQIESSFFKSKLSEKLIRVSVSDAAQHMVGSNQRQRLALIIEGGFDCQAGKPGANFHHIVGIQLALTQ